MKFNFFCILLALVAVLLLMGCTLPPGGCTKDAKICPDGTSVSRVPPNCDFAPCPSEDGLLSCESDSDCPSGFACFNSQYAAPRGDGTAATGNQLGDLKCHKECLTNADCPTSFPSCREQEIIHGDAIDRVKICLQESGNCAGEGESIPVIPNPPECCTGLRPIPPKERELVGISGICTALCGNGVCDSATESGLNCPEDCSPDTNCIAEGQVGGSEAPVVKPCCPGLTNLNYYGPDVNSANCQFWTDVFVCANCGNGICGAGENSCNCPADCNVQAQ